jgi:hypothetical protein
MEGTVVVDRNIASPAAVRAYGIPLRQKPAARLESKISIGYGTDRANFCQVPRIIVIHTDLIEDINFCVVTSFENAQFARPRDFFQKPHATPAQDTPFLIV